MTDLKNLAHKYIRSAYQIFDVKHKYTQLDMFSKKTRVMVVSTQKIPFDPRGPVLPLFKIKIRIHIYNFQKI